jgi:hypothetical protein
MRGHERRRLWVLAGDQLPVAHRKRLPVGRAFKLATQFAQTAFQLKGHHGGQACRNFFGVGEPKSGSYLVANNPVGGLNCPIIGAILSLT